MTHTTDYRNGFLKAGALVAVAGVLYAAREICIPFALAILLAFMLAPVVARLQKWHFGRVPSVLVVMLLVVGLIGSVGWLVLGQFEQLAEQLPQYRTTVHEKLDALHTKPGGTFDRLNHTFDDYANEVAAITSQPATTEPAATQPADTLPAGSQRSADAPDRSELTSGGPAANSGVAESAPGQSAMIADTQPQSAAKAIAVTVTKPRTTGMDILRSAIAGVLHPMLVLGIVLILTLFMLLQWQDLRDRVLRLVGRGQLQMSTKTFDDAGNRVSRYLLTQVCVNIVFGACVFAGLFFIGVPNSPLWGLVATALRFLPYFGVPAAAVPPVILAFVTGHGFAGMMLTLGLFVCLEILIGYVAEPFLYGSKTGISPLAILGSALFWGWIWGPVGLLLSTPLTVCLAVIGRHVPGLAFLHVIFGDEPALSPAQRFYQRMLAGDQDEATEIAEGVLHDGSPLKLYDDVLLPALLMAERDRRRGELDDDARQKVYGFMRALIEDVEDRYASPASQTGPAVLCIAASSDADELAARMLGGQLRRLGAQVTLLPMESLAGEGVKRADDIHPDVVCISALPPQAILHARYLAKRFRESQHGLRIVVGLWACAEEKAAVESRLPATLVDAIATTISAAADHVALQRSTEAHPELAAAGR